MIKNLFPLGIATGAAHCNRKRERDELKDNILRRNHVWLWARRRMGKTSLMEQVLGELSRARPTILSMKLDLNVVHDAESLEERMREAASRLGVALIPKGRKQTGPLLRAFDSFRPEFSVGALGMKMTLRKPDAVVPGISEILMSLDAAAGHYKRQAVIVLDEFQQLSGLTYGRSDYTLEGAIRHAVERAEHITYVFSGSQRHLLADMFENADRPLFRLCRKMGLARITTEDYRRFFNKASKVRWSKTLPEEVPNAISSLTHRHPYYVNALCARLWDGDKPPTVKQVSAAWGVITNEDAAVVSYIVRNLSATQRAMLLGIARSGTVEYPTGRSFLASIRLSASTGSGAKDVLEANDLIRQNDDNRWELVDPVMAEYLRRASEKHS